MVQGRWFGHWERSSALVVIVSHILRWTLDRLESLYNFYWVVCSLQFAVTVISLSNPAPYCVIFTHDTWVLKECELVYPPRSQIGLTHRTAFEPQTFHFLLMWLSNMSKSFSSFLPLEAQPVVRVIASRGQEWADHEIESSPTIIYQDVLGESQSATSTIKALLELQQTAGGVPSWTIHLLLLSIMLPLALSLLSRSS